MSEPVDGETFEATNEPPDVEAPTQGSRSGGLLLAGVFGFLAARLIIPWLPGLPPGINQIVSIGLFVGLSVGLLYIVVGDEGIRRARWLVLLTMLAAWITLLVLRIEKPMVVLVAVRAAQDLCLVIASGAVGLVVAPVLKEKSILVPIVGAAATFDALYVMLAPMQTILSKKPDVALDVAAMVPALGMGKQPGMMTGEFLVGPGDLLMIGFLFAVCRHFSLRGRRTFWLTAGLMWAALIVVALTQLPLPGWVFLGAAFLIANHGAIRLSAEERKITTAAFVVGVLLVIAAAAYLVMKGPPVVPAG